MKANLTIILSAAGLAALLAPFAAATPLCPAGRPCQPHTVYVPGRGGIPGAYVEVTPTTESRGARGAVVVTPHGPAIGIVPGINGEGPYTPDIPSPRYGDSGDFQTGGADSR